MTPFFHSLFAPLILFPSYTHTHMIFLPLLFSLAVVITFRWPVVTVTHPLAKGTVNDRFTVKEPPSIWDGHLCSAHKMWGCFPAAPVSLLALSTAVAIQNAAHRRENAAQPNTDELRAFAHLFPHFGSRLWAPGWVNIWYMACVVPRLEEKSIK